LTKTARTQLQTILFFRDPFRLIPIENIAEIADKFTRNEILSANEIRGVIGYAPSKDPKADKLINSNMPQGSTTETAPASSNGHGNPDAVSVTNGAGPYP
jgi:predicted component of type VI protein secretion system